MPRHFALRRRPRILVIAAAAIALASAVLLAPTASNATTPMCGGAVLYKADHTRWVCSFDDEFTGSTLDTTKWQVITTPTSGFTTGMPGSQVCYMNTKNNVSVSAGALHL